jgi:hypothetical protein
VTITAPVGDNRKKPGRKRTITTQLVATAPRQRRRLLDDIFRFAVIQQHPDGQSVGGDAVELNLIEELTDRRHTRS